jgi:hypothetical protein
MKLLYAAAVAGLTLLGSVGSGSAQPYGGRGYGYEGRGYGGDGYGFDEGEYLRCNPDVRRAVRRGQMRSGAAHFREYGRREHRRLSC